MPRWIAIDYGAKRIGIALCDPDERIASPAGILPGTGDVAADARRVADLSAEHRARHVVVGLPLNMDGTVGPQARLHQELARCLAAAGLTVETFDERLTSFQAEDWLRQTGLTHAQKKRVRDSLAAVAILQAFLAARHASAGETSPEPAPGDGSPAGDPPASGGREVGPDVGSDGAAD